MESVSGLRDLEFELQRLGSSNFQRLRFEQHLEDQFERDTASRRSHRLWFEGLLAIVAANACLIVDYLLIKDGGWQTMMLRTMLLTPVALLVNSLMRRNPRRWIREGSVAAGTTLIASINLYAQGTSSSTRSMFGLICVLIAILFADVMMRLRFFYAVSATSLMFAGGLWFLAQARTLQASEKVVGASLLMAAAAITLLANYSMEREERMNYLLSFRGRIQSEELLERNASLWRLSSTDKLTGLPNRRTYEERFEELWREAEVTRSPLAKIMVDVDHFKQLNDVKGHIYGDEILERVASLIRSALRGQADFAARYGGEEFVVLLPETDIESALMVAERIRSLIEVASTPPHEPDSASPLMWATASCGVSVCIPGPGLHRIDLLAAADRGLYRAKADGRNRVSYRACEPPVPAEQQAFCAEGSLVGL